MQNNKIHITFTELETEAMIKLLGRYIALEESELQRNRVKDAKSNSFERIGYLLKGMSSHSILEDALRFRETFQQKELAL